jgi:hypothetical protein
LTRGSHPALDGPEGRESLLERRGVDTHDRTAGHLEQAAVGVPGEAFAAGGLGEAQHRVVVQADGEDRLRHAGHGEPGPGADGQQQRVVRLSQPPSGLLLQGQQVLGDLTRQALRLGAGGQEGPAGLGGLVKPGGTGGPSRVISARFEPLPPSRPAMSRPPSVKSYT